jgi:hypothetical protein
MSLRTIETTVESDSINDLTSINLYFNWRAIVFLKVSRNQHQFRTNNQQTKESLVVSFTSVSVNLLKGYWSLWKGLEKR